MMRPIRIALKTLAGLAILAVIVLVAGVWAMHSAWFENLVRTRIIADAETATGGRVEIGTFRFDWSTLTAQIDNLTIHGTEPAGAAPLLAADRVTVGLRIISMLERTFDVSSVNTEHPRVHLIVNTDGSTNVPKPGVAGRRSSVSTILDLKVGRFDVADGLILTDSPGLPNQKPPFAWNARGDKLTAHIDWNSRESGYDGRISIEPLHFVSTRSAPLDASVEFIGSLTRNQFAIPEARVSTPDSQINLASVLISDFSSPVATGSYSARISAREAGKILQLSPAPSGNLAASGSLRYRSLADFEINGTLNGTAVNYGRVNGAAINTVFNAKPDRIDFTSTRVRWREGQLVGAAHLGPRKSFAASGRADHFRAAGLATLFAPGTKLPWDALLSGTVEANGSFNAPVLAAHLTAVAAPGETPIHADLDIHYDQSARELRFAPSWITLPHTRVDASGVFGARLAVKAQSSDLADLLPLLNGQSIPLTLQNGSVAFDGTVSGPIANPAITGHGAVSNATFRGQNITSAAGNFTLDRDSVKFTDLEVNAAQISARVSGTLGLAAWLPQSQSAVNASVRLTNTGVPQIIALSGAGSLPVSGTLNTTAQITGTLGEPHAAATYTLMHGQIAGENYDQISGNAQYRGNGVENLTASMTAGATRVNFSSQFEHAPGTLLPARVSFDLAPSSLVLNQLAFVRSRAPDLTGTVQAKASGAFELSRDPAGHVSVIPTRIDAQLDAQRVILASRNLGEVHLTATTTGNIVNAQFNSNLPGAALRGQAAMNLTAGYPVRGNITFADANPAILVALARGPGAATPVPFAGTTAGELTFSGSALSPGSIDAGLALNTLTLRPAAQVPLVPAADSKAPAQKFELRNEGPVRLALKSSRVQIDAAHFTGPNTDVFLNGTLPLNGQQPLDAGLNGSINLALAQMFTPGLTSSGGIAMNARIGGTWNNPSFSGRADITKGDFRYADYTNGLANTNGVVLFNGTRATIQNLTAESGGGKVDVSGFGALTGGQFAFRLDLKTSNVRVRYPPGISSVSDARITVAGTSLRSDASGTINIRRITINPGADAATMLVRTAQPLQLGSAGVGPLATMNLDVQVSTSADTLFETSLAESIQADANLRLRGTLSNPTLLGRINVTEGDVTFFGNRYTINQGSVSFLNPARIDPILNVDLETKARGVDVILNVAGPIDKLNVTYRSDPPLQFGDIVALLATGRTPTDPTLAIRDTGQQQSFQQLGASELLGQAITNPVAGRLQRFFGVSKLKIDPQLTGVTGSPEARLTIEQQVTPDILFTYISDVSNTSTQLIRVEWAFNRRWSAILTREENGYVGVDFAYKTHLK